MTHPLTDDIIEEIKSDVFSQAPKILTPGIAPSVWSSDCMRAAYDKGADWQLEQVIKWLKTTKYYLCPSVLADQLQEAMRPQEDTP